MMWLAAWLPAALFQGPSQTVTCDSWPQHPVSVGASLAPDCPLLELYALLIPLWHALVSDRRCTAVTTRPTRSA